MSDPIDPTNISLVCKREPVGPFKYAVLIDNSPEMQQRIAEYYAKHPERDPESELYDESLPYDPDEPEPVIGYWAQEDSE